MTQDAGDTAVRTFTDNAVPSTAVVRRVRIQQQATFGVAVRVAGLDLSLGGTAEQVQVRVSQAVPGAFLVGLQAANGAVVRDSVVQAIGSGTAATAGEALLLNDTFLSPGNGVQGAACGGLGGNTDTHTRLVNSLVRAGDESGTTEISGLVGQCNVMEPAVSGSVAVDHSNFRPDRVGVGVAQGAGNQSGAPLLDAAFAPLTGSPTIDAGTTDPQLGSADVFGGARVSGAAPDIGAAEFVSTPPAAGPAPGGTGNPPPPAGAGAGASKDSSAPALSAVKLKSARVRSGGAVRLGLRLSEAATVTVRFERLVPGHRRGKRCSATARRGPRCTIAKAAGSVTRPATAGARTLALGARVGGRRLAPGTYRVTVSARDAAGNRSRPALAKLVVTR